MDFILKWLRGVLMTKNEFRKSCLRRLQFQSRFAKIKKDYKLNLEIKKVIDYHKPKKILFYLPLKNEVDLTKLMKSFRQENRCKVYVPFMKGDSFIPVLYRLPLKRKRFGIKEPYYSSLQEKKIDLDMIIVPIVGVDATYRRVGFGAGMYDRFYEKISKKPVVIFTQLTLCKTFEIVTDTHDIGPDYIITM